MQQTNPNKLKIIVAVLFVAVAGIALFNISLNANRSGKIATTIEVMPEDATITIDGKRSNHGTVYLEPGSHTFVASKTGFTDDKETLTISAESNYVGLLPAPVSDEARKWAEQAEIIDKIESITGSIASAEGSITTTKNPLINYLPESNIEAPYTISYRLVENDSGGEDAVIIIKNATPSGRIKALAWIKEQGFDPADLQIEFEDFQNQLEAGD